MKISKDPIIPRKIDMDENPAGVDKAIHKHREKEKKGRYVKVSDKIWILVKEGENEQEKVSRFLKKYSHASRNVKDGI